MNGMSKVHLYFVAFDTKLMISIFYIYFLQFLITAGDYVNGLRFYLLAII